MSKHKGVAFSLLISIVIFFILTIADLVSITITPEILLENFFICIISFIIIYISYNRGYTDGYDDASRKQFDSYLDGFDAGCDFITNHIKDMNFDD